MGQGVSCAGMQGCWIPDHGERTWGSIANIGGFGFSQLGIKSFAA